MSVRANTNTRLYVAELPSPRLFLGPAKFTKSMLEQTPKEEKVKKSNTKRKQHYPHLYVKG